MELLTLLLVNSLTVLSMSKFTAGQQPSAVSNFLSNDVTYYCGAYVDLVLMVESSVYTRYTGVNGVTSWHPGLSLFLTKLMQTLRIDPTSFRIAVILYGSDIDDILPFTVQKIFAIHAISYLRPRFGSRVHTARGLQEMRRLLTYYGRPGAGKRTVLISGSSSENLESTLKEAKLAESLGIDLVSVGFGPYHNVRELQTISPGRTLDVSDAGMLYALVGRLAARLCVEPVHGAWSPWTKWSPCSKSCDSGQTRRFRYCNNPTPQLGGSGCVGPQEMRMQCNEQPCLSFFVGSYWTMWSGCSALCGRGTQTRTRPCLEEFSKTRCNDAGQEVNVRPCYSGSCAVDGGWTVWSSWSTCSVTCGDGTRQRSRYCTNPVPTYGGRNCSGSNLETIPCFTLRKCMDCGDCMWNKDATYLGCNDDCAKYVQCTQYGRTSIEQRCPHGLLWSNDKINCVHPDLSECKPCAGKPAGSEVQYSLSCREYWKCLGGGKMELRCCDVGLVFIPEMGCVDDYTKTCQTECLSQKYNKAQCDPVVNLTFTSPSLDKTGSISETILQSIRYLDNGNAILSQNSSISFPGLSQYEWKAPFSIHIRLHTPTKTSLTQSGVSQAILHNAGCPASDNPTLLVALDTSSDYFLFTFGIVLSANPEMLFINITSIKSSYSDVSLRLQDTRVTAEVNGRKSSVEFETKETIAKNSNPLQVGGSICTSSYWGFTGRIDQITIDKCNEENYKKK